MCFYLYEYSRAETEEARHKNKMSVVRYLLDTVVSHNEFSKRRFTINPKVTCLIGLLSSLINISLVWK